MPTRTPHHPTSPGADTHPALTGFPLPVVTTEDQAFAEATYGILMRIRAAIEEIREHYETPDRLFVLNTDEGHVAYDDGTPMIKLRPDLSAHQRARHQRLRDEIDDLGHALQGALDRDDGRIRTFGRLHCQTGQRRSTTLLVVAPDAPLLEGAHGCTHLARGGLGFGTLLSDCAETDEQCYPVLGRLARLHAIWRDGILFQTIPHPSRLHHVRYWFAPGPDPRPHPDDRRALVTPADVDPIPFGARCLAEEAFVLGSPIPAFARAEIDTR